MKIIPMHTPRPRDVAKEPHDRSPRWLGEGKAAVWTEPTPDEEEKEDKGKWIPCFHCHALPEDGQFRLINLRWGIRQRCRACKKEHDEAILAAEWDARHSHEQRVRAFLKAKHVPVVTRGRNAGKVLTPSPKDPWEKEWHNDRDSTGVDYGEPQLVTAPNPEGEDDE